MSNSSGWRNFDGESPESVPPELQELIAEEANQQPIAEVTVQLYGLDSGQSKLQV